MSKYKVVFKADRDTAGSYALAWEPECPVQITAVQISRNVESSATFLQVKVRNVSSECISSIVVELEARLLTGETEQTSLDYLDVDIAAATEIALKPRQLAHANVTACKLTVNRTNGSKETWQSTGFAKPLPAHKELQLSRRALEQRARALEVKADDRTIKGAVQDHETWWVCACGQINVERDDCCVCGNKKQMLLENEDEAKLLKDADAYSERIYEKAEKNINVDNLRKAINLLESIPDWNDAKIKAEQCRKKIAEEENTRQKRARKITIMSISSLVAIVAIALLVVFICIPIFHYNEAVRLTNENNFEAAVNLASEIGGIEKDAAQSIKREAQYQYIINNFDRENETTCQYLTELIGMNYRDSRDLYARLFTPPVEIAFTKEGNTPTLDDWKESTTTATVRNEDDLIKTSKYYNLWIRAYCPPDSVLNIEVKGDFLRWSGESMEQQLTFHYGDTDEQCLTKKDGSDIPLKLYVTDLVPGTSKYTVTVACDGKTLCEKSLEMPSRR